MKHFLNSAFFLSHRSSQVSKYVLPVPFPEQRNELFLPDHLQPYRLSAPDYAEPPFPLHLPDPGHPFFFPASQASEKNDDVPLLLYMPPATRQYRHHCTISDTFLWESEPKALFSSCLTASIPSPPGGKNDLQSVFFSCSVRHKNADTLLHGCV